VSGAIVTPFVVMSAHGDVRLAIVGLILAACVGTGLAFSSDGITALDGLALGSSATALLTALSMDEYGLCSLSAAIIGGQLVLYGIARNDAGLRIAGAAVGGVALCTLPFTTGAYNWLTRAVAPHGITVADLNVTAIVLALTAAGLLVRRFVTATSWLAFGPALTVAAVHLISTVSTTQQPGRAGVAIGVGVLALVVGGLRKLGAPLFIGTGLVIAPTIIMVGPALATLSMWLWVALGGAALIAAAIVIERTLRASQDPNASATETAKRIWSTLG
jgi:hypothetical protein